MGKATKHRSRQTNPVAAVDALDGDELAGLAVAHEARHPEVARPDVPHRLVLVHPCRSSSRGGPRVGGLPRAYGLQRARGTHDGRSRGGRRRSRNLRRRRRREAPGGGAARWGRAEVRWVGWFGAVRRVDGGGACVGGGAWACGAGGDKYWED
jgi:hypothetical protein